MSEKIKILLEYYTEQQRAIFSKINNFDVFRVNFEARTSWTVKTVAKVIDILLARNHIEEAKVIFQNLKEELGIGYPKSHPELLVDAFDEISPKKDIKLTTATTDFINYKNDLLKSFNNNRILANFCAHELAASSMLKEIKNRFFTNSNPLYFKIHLDGTEDRHAEDAIALVKELVPEEEVLSEVKRFFELQLNFFEALQ